MNEQLNIIWTTSEKDVALKVILKYAFNSINNGWWKHVNIILWGPSVKCVAEDTHLQNEIIDLLHKGVTIQACLDCAESYNAVENLTKLNINIKPLGEPITNYIKEKEHIITF